MKAMTVPKYGQMVLRDLEPPVPGPNDVLVDAVAASLNAADWHVILGDPFPLRLVMGLSKPKIKGAGADVSGRVRQVGDSVTAFKPGDEVVADLSGVGFGAFAEQICAPASAWVKKPASLSFEEAAALPLAGMTALKGLRDVAALKTGERVLVIGAAGGVGSLAVSIARALGAHVTAVCRREKVDTVKRLGVVDILETEQLQAALAQGSLDHTFDVILDCAAFRSPFSYNRLLKAGGRFVLVGGSNGSFAVVALFGAIAKWLTGHSYRAVMQKANNALLTELFELVARANIRPLLDKTFPLVESDAALRHMKDRNVRGKVVIRVAR